MNEWQKYKRRLKTHGGKGLRRWKAIREHGAYCHNCLALPSPFSLLQIHHILPVRDYPHFKNDTANLIPLCPNCHLKADAGKIPIEKLLKL